MLSQLSDPMKTIFVFKKVLNDLFHLHVNTHEAYVLLDY